MWHWNSLWAPAPGDPPAIDDPILWRSPWSFEQSVALQASTWEAILSASHSWWTMALTAWPLPAWQHPGQIAAPAETAATNNRLALVVNKPHAPGKSSTPRKRAAKPDDRHSLQARKH